jgi:hypothetical protein
MNRNNPLALAAAASGLLYAVLSGAPAPSLAQTAENPGSVIGDNAATESDTDLARQIQNPVGDLISLPLQDNVNFGYGPHKAVQNVLNLQPVIPFHVNDDWNIITRTILPIVWNPDLSPASSVPVGLAPTSFTAFLSPSHDVNGWLWGAGPVVQLPLISSATLGSSVWGAGPSAVIVYSTGPWVAGALVNNIWSLGRTHGPAGNGYSTFLANPFVAYNFDSGWYISAAPNITANWQANGTKWTVPIGGGPGRVFRIGSLPVDLSLSVYYNVVRPSYGAPWQLSLQLTFIF